MAKLQNKVQAIEALRKLCTEEKVQHFDEARQYNDMK